MSELLNTKTIVLFSDNRQLLIRKPLYHLLNSLNHLKISGLVRRLLVDIVNCNWINGLVERM